MTDHRTPALRSADRRIAAHLDELARPPLELEEPDVDALAADLAHLRVIGVRLGELAADPGGRVLTLADRAELVTLAELVEQLAAVTFRRIFDEELPELERRPR